MRISEMTARQQLNFALSGDPEDDDTIVCTGIPFSIGTRVTSQDGRTGTITGYMGSDSRYVRYDGGKRNVCVKIAKLTQA